MKNKIIAAIGAGALIALVAVPAMSATEGSVVATVTPQLVSLTVVDGSIDYGTLDINKFQGTALGDGDALDDTQVVTNTGNVNEDFTIRGQNSDDWALAGATGSEQYKHEFCITTCDSTPVLTALTTTAQSLIAGVAANGTQDVDLKISTPSSTTATAAQSVDVTVIATAS